MPQTYGDLRAHAEQIVAGNTDARLDVKDIINHAGNWLCESADWTWLERPPVKLPFVADQDFITLPVDFGKLISIHPTTGIVAGVIVTTASKLNELRSDRSTYDYYVAVEWPPPGSESEGAPQARLGLYPTPSATTEDQIRMTYQARWRWLTMTHHVAMVPPDVESLLIAAVRAISRGYLDEQRYGGRGVVRTEGVMQRLDSLMQSSTYQQMVSKYGMTQGDLGQLEGGIVDFENEFAIFRPYQTLTRA